MKARRRRWLAAWVVLLAASHALRALQDRRPRARGPDERVVDVTVGEGASARTVGLFFRELAPPASDPARPPLLLLHGSPGRGDDLLPLARALARERTVLLPDLPGFGRSRERVPDYSNDAHARALLQLLDRRGLARVDVVGFSMGGGVALRLVQRAPERVRTVALLGSIGVVELELFGDQRLNHLVHGIQRAALLALLEGVPHFGLLDRQPLSGAYARNFYDTDQGPLRAILERVEAPVLILHGEDDPLVPAAAAREHARLVPQSEVELLEGGHFLPFQQPDLLAGRLEAFLRAADDGRARERADATPERLARAALAFDPRDVPPLAGLSLALFCASATVATFVSEDLVCLGVGALVGRGRVPFWPGTIACLVGITLGDVLLFLAGRTLGRRALRRRPWSWILHEERVAQCSRWFQRRGPAVILVCRLMPGLRLPTYFAAGLLHTRVALFVTWFVIAGAIWTPLVVWGAARLGDQLARRLELLERHLLLGVLATLLAGYALVRWVLPLATRRGRALARVRLLRLVRWEYWPPWFFYAPLVPWLAWRTLRHGGRPVFTATNPGIPHGGFVGESKGAILRALAESGAPVPPTETLSAALPAGERLARAERFLARHGLALPVVVKPDVGERGSGVRVCRDREALADALGVGGAPCAPGDLLLQAYVGGEEFGVFYARRPDDPRGRVLSITEKHLPAVTGDGVSTLEALVLSDRRAAGCARLHLERHAERLADVPAAGERVLLGELGTHCRGATFLDGARHASAALEEAVERVSRGLPGFFFGRYDLRAASAEELSRGRFQVLELNGVTSEMTHVYDPRYSALDGWRTIAGQWRLAFAIGAANAARGARVSRLGELVREVLRARARGRAAPARGGGGGAESASHAPAEAVFGPGPGEARGSID